MSLPAGQKIIFHIDMNSYFASCEQQANPHLRGKPVGVCEHLGGIIIAPSIEAKKFGIKTAMPVWEAKKLYPKIILLYTDPEKYRATTGRFLNILYSYNEAIEKYSIDEAFMDLTDNFKNEFDPWAAAEQTAKEIKAKIKLHCGEWIRCSIGIGQNKLIAKIGSDLQKPDGLTLVRPEAQELLYDRLKLTDIPGIGRRMEAHLNAIGVKTLRQLRDYPAQNLYAHFGIMGYHLHKIGQLQASWYENDFGGESDEQEIKSMGHAYTLPQNTSDKKIALQVLYKLSEMVGRRLREAGLCGCIVHFILNAKNGEYLSKQHKLNFYIDEGREIFLEAAKIFDSYDFPKTFRLIGVTVAGLKPKVAQGSLFEQDRRRNKLTEYLDKINDRYGEFTISRIPAWQARNVIRDSIGFGRMREFKVKYKKGK